MHDSYIDITSRIAEDPMWWDANGTPRYGEFIPHRCPNIYAHWVWLYRIACQSCGKEFEVEEHDVWFATERATPKNSHYGDPPIHGCTGDTMNCDDLEVLEVWNQESKSWEWVRHPELEGSMTESWNKGEKTSEQEWKEDD